VTAERHSRAPLERHGALSRGDHRGGCDDAVRRRGSIFYLQACVGARPVGLRVDDWRVSASGPEAPLGRAVAKRAMRRSRMGIVQASFGS
jgi:O-acetyl-ADP-ribose deacetylase (regulator of RNase III)